MLPDIQPGNTKILYFFNCLLDGMHTIRIVPSFQLFLRNPAQKLLQRLSTPDSTNQLKKIWGRGQEK